MTFPCWRYHHTEQPRIFHSLEELELAGNGWVDSAKKTAAPAKDVPAVPATPKRPFPVVNPKIQPKTAKGGR